MERERTTNKPHGFLTSGLGTGPEEAVIRSLEPTRNKFIIKLTVVICQDAAK